MPKLSAKGWEEASFQKLRPFEKMEVSLKNHRTWDHVLAPACRVLLRPILFGAFKWGARKKNGGVSEGEDSRQSINLDGRQERERRKGKEGGKQGRREGGRGERRSFEVGSRVLNKSPIRHCTFAGKHTCNTREGGRCYNTQVNLFLGEGDKRLEMIQTCRMAIQ